MKDFDYFVKIEMFQPATEGIARLLLSTYWLDKNRVGA